MIPLIFLAFLFPASLFAVENGVRPEIPPAEVELKDTGGLTPREYFAKRKANKPCRDALDAAKAAEEKAPAAKKKAFHEAYLEKVVQCGDCDLVPMGKPIVVEDDGSHTEHWYVSKGFCQLDLAEGDFERLSRSLLDLKQYPAKNGGFSHIAFFDGFESKTKNPLAVATKSPFDAAIAVKGPVLGKLEGAIGYFVENEFNDLEKKPDFFHLGFKNTDMPQGFDFPSLTTPQGFPLPLVQLSFAKGSWFLTRDGYVRYFTAADFPGILAFGATVAKEIMLDTLLEFRTRGAKR